jgi:3-methyl-2-oxobutanoate hydroxymethyltransferase
MKTSKVTVKTILQMKKNGERIAALTAYDYLFASILDNVGLDIILVGDSTGMIYAGYDTTIPVTMDEMVYHLKAVRRGIKRSLLVGDMPFMSFQLGESQALENAGRFLKEGGAEAVKLEGGRHLVPTIKKLTEIGIPVMGHLGLTPQSINIFGSWNVQAKSPEARKRLKDDALHLQDAGVFSIVLEKIPADLAEEVTQSLEIPTIGIGAGKECDGQILVTHDLLGLFEKFRPRFVRRYAELAQEIRRAVGQYASDVKSGTFPSLEESF